MALDDTTKGYLAVVTSILFFGSFGSFVKSHAVQSRAVHPIVVQLYFSVAIFVTGFATVIWEEFELTAYGALGGLIWTCCSLLSFVSITHAGLGRAEGLWSGSSIVTSFFIGTVGFHEHLKSLAWSLVALALMLLGVAAIAGVDTGCVKSILFGFLLLLLLLLLFIYLFCFLLFFRLVSPFR